MDNSLNAYIQSPVREKVWTTLVPDFGKDAEKTQIYGLNENQTRRWGKVLLLLIVLHQQHFMHPSHSDSMLEQLHESFPLKLGFGNPDMSLAVKSCKTRLHYGVWAWAMR